MATARQIIEKAQSFIGTKEDNNGNVIFNAEYYGRNIGHSAWCCTFVWYIFEQCKASNLFCDGKKVAYCPTVGDWAIANNLTVPKTEGKYGDIVLFDWDKNGNSDHIGFILKKNADGSYQTIEGNTSISNQANGGMVMERTRYISTINYIIRPKYDTDNKSLTCTAHIQSIGWTQPKKEGETCGTIGQGKRLEAFAINSDSANFTYQVHMQTYGDRPECKNGEVAGSIGLGKRIESIKINCDKPIMYRVHQQTYGWSKWVTNNVWCGKKGESKRIEAIEVKFSE